MTEGVRLTKAQRRAFRQVDRIETLIRAADWTSLPTGQLASCTDALRIALDDMEDEVNAGRAALLKGEG